MKYILFFYINYNHVNNYLNEFLNLNNYNTNNLSNKEQKKISKYIKKNKILNLLPFNNNIIYFKK